MQTTKEKATKRVKLTLDQFSGIDNIIRYGYKTYNEERQAQCRHFADNFIKTLTKLKKEIGEEEYGKIKEVEFNITQKTIDAIKEIIAEWKKKTDEFRTIIESVNLEEINLDKK